MENWAKEQLGLALSKVGLSRVMVRHLGELCVGRVIGEGGLKEPSLELEIRTLHDLFPQDFGKRELMKMYVKGELHFLPEMNPSAKRGDIQLMLCPWGMVGGEVPQDKSRGQNVWMALCVSCGYWREIPGATRRKFVVDRKDFRCANSPWLTNCASPRTEFEATFTRVGNSIKDRRD